MSRTSFGVLLGFLYLAITSIASPSLSFAQATPGYVIAVLPLVPPSITAPAGGTATAKIIVNSVDGYSGSIHFSCVVSGPKTPFPSCPDPPSVTLASGGVAVSTMTVTTNNLTPTGTYTFKIRAGDTNDHGPLAGGLVATLDVQHQYGVSGGGGGIALLTFIGLTGMWAFGRMRRRRAA